MASQSTPVFSPPVVASATVPARRFITIAGAVPEAGATALGVNRAPVEDGDTATVDVLGTAQVEAGAEIAAGAGIEVGTAGKAITLDDGVQVGRALEAAAADGDIIEVLLIPS